jgi:hypothetical protein
MIFLISAARDAVSAVRRLVGKFDPAPSATPKAGERSVVEFERDQLRLAGRDGKGDFIRTAASGESRRLSGTPVNFVDFKLSGTLTWLQCQTISTTR